MKQLRTSKKDPSKILKIIDVPQSHRYGNLSPSQEKEQKFESFVMQSSRQKSKQERSRNLALRYSNLALFQSHKSTKFTLKDGSPKIKQKSYNKSEEDQEKQKDKIYSTILRSSLNSKKKNDYSPYLERKRLRSNSKSFMQSANFIDRSRKDSKELAKNNVNSSKKRNISFRLESLGQGISPRKDEQAMISEAKDLLNKGQHRKSLLIAKSVLKSHPEHTQSLFISAVNHFNLQAIDKSIQCLQRLIQINPNFNQECYKILAVCCYKQMSYSKCFKYLEQSHEYFPFDSESYNLKGKILMRIKRFQEASLSFLKACQIEEKAQYLANLATCYENLEMLEEGIQIYQKLLSISTIFKQKSEILKKKNELHLQLSQFQAIIQSTNQAEEQNMVFNNLKDKAQVYYQAAFAYYKLKNYSQAIVAGEEGLKTGQLISKISTLLIMIKIEERDFYEAFHIAERLERNPELIEPDLKIIISFVEGAISLMRRNYADGVSTLQSIKQQMGLQKKDSTLSSNNSPRERQKNLVRRKSIKKAYQNSSEQFMDILKSIYNIFLSYGYYCLGQFETCQNLIKKQEQTFKDDIIFKKGLQYNLKMCEGIISHCRKQYKEAAEYFYNANLIQNRKKLEPIFCSAINFVQLLINDVELSTSQYIQKAKQSFNQTVKIIGNSTNNTSANVFYHKSLFHAYIGQWKQALLSIDQAIDRSQDHYWRYFYIRGMLFACIHSFRQAINDLSVAINLCNQAKAQCFLLRSRCLQIQGEGNEAFKDLQEYISLKPDDRQIHKYAGQLLFENGAFQDALSAFDHQQIQENLSNFDVLLTQTKSYFLLGKFQEASKIMHKASMIKPEVQQIKFDAEMLTILQSIVYKKCSFQQALKDIEKVYQVDQQKKKQGRIFKMLDYFVLAAVCQFYSGNYEKSIQKFTEAIQEKTRENTLIEEQAQDDTSFKQAQKDIQTFANQMHYNQSIAYLVMSNYEMAAQKGSQIKIGQELLFYQDFMEYMMFLRREVTSINKEQIFPNRNKLSNFLDKAQIKNVEKGKISTFSLKLCIPFPKVQPPQIFPELDIDLIHKLTVLNVQKKPQAPWVMRENNCIKFTDKMQTYSKLEIDQSQADSVSTFQMLEVDNSHLQVDSLRKTRKSLKKVFKLQEEVETKLNKHFEKKNQLL